MMMMHGIFVEFDNKQYECKANPAMEMEGKPTAYCCWIEDLAYVCNFEKTNEGWVESDKFAKPEEFMATRKVNEWKPMPDEIKHQVKQALEALHPTIDMSI